MHEETLRGFFVGTISAAELRLDLEGTAVRTSSTCTEYDIADMTDDFEVAAIHLVRICDAVVEGKLAPEHLESIGFCLEASDRFSYAEADAEVVADVVSCWSSPEINYALTTQSARLFGQWLRNGKNPFPTDDVA